MLISPFLEKLLSSHALQIDHLTTVEMDFGQSLAFDLEGAFLPTLNVVIQVPRQDLG